MTAYYLVFDAKGAFGSGGWSRKAKHKPQPRAVKFEGEVIISPKKKRVIMGGITKNKATVFDDSVPPVLIRADYKFDVLRGIGAELPPIYIDRFGYMRRSVDGSIVMEGPQ